ncbi:MAG: altronate dehydratase family protein [Alphaproteobacteria bacterium]|jgi:altronate hydrolase|nr:altronate dehydratase family protein [Alphaproteobacteria bacterium]MDP6567502.1 altronate dehydratase family protein [Alphaproteobacteria bacterium]MDP6813337.1 altronate dehydratase family protein [Alphaproteobacteria bacterium]
MTQAQPTTIRLHGNDNVVVARAEVPPETAVPGEGVRTNAAVPAGHKIATAPIAKGEPVRKYDQIIGFASAEIAPGDHVHTQNVEVREFERDYQYGTDTQAIDFVPEDQRATFRGIRREDGRIATRNYIGVLTSVNCSATAARVIADSFRGDALADYPNVDGVVALTHDYGCGGCAGIGLNYIQRTLAGYARHPNFAGVVMVGLGCEANQIGALMEAEKLNPSDKLHTFTIQDTGGSTATVDKGVGLIREMLPEANRAERTMLPASELILGLECGGSDAYSGISANPALGAAADLLVRHGGTACLAETPEIYGAEHLLTRRAVSQEVGEKLLAHIEWWRNYTRALGAEMNNNPSPGNKAGGLTTILEKSLGAAAKGGTTNLVDVYQYAEPITQRGFVFMDTPGYDPASITGMVAGGANISCFTTGRGSVFGGKPVPCLKLATNSTMFDRMTDDMDINCGRVIDGEATVGEMGQAIFERILTAASGEAPKSEVLGVGGDEFVPWTVGAIL